MNILGLAIWVLIQNVYLTHSINRYKRAEVVSAFVIPGARLTQIMGVDLTGHVKEVDLRSDSFRHLLLITVRPDCPTCISHIDKWHHISGDLRRQGWKVLWVSGSTVRDTQSFFASHKMLDENVLINPDHLAATSLKLDTVPVGGWQTAWRLTSEQALKVIRFGV